MTRRRGRGAIDHAPYADNATLMATLAADAAREEASEPSVPDGYRQVGFGGGFYPESWFERYKQPSLMPILNALASLIRLSFENPNLSDIQRENLRLDAKLARESFDMMLSLEKRVQLLETELYYQPTMYGPERFSPK